MKAYYFGLPARELSGLERELLALLGGGAAPGREDCAENFEAVGAFAPPAAANGPQAFAAPARGGFFERLRLAAGERMASLRAGARRSALYPGDAAAGDMPGGVEASEDERYAGSDGEAEGLPAPGELRRRLEEAEAAAKRAFLLASAVFPPSASARGDGDGQEAAWPGGGGRGSYDALAAPRGAREAYGALPGGGTGTGGGALAGCGAAQDAAVSEGAAGGVRLVSAGGSGGAYAQGARLPAALGTDMQAVSDYFRRASRRYDGGYKRY